ncbi:MAG: sulfatase-like hydrolase/transferase [Opitutales bacterium]
MSDLRRPNIILIMSDDQGWGQVGYMDHPHLKGKTPHLDQMAREGIRFDRFYAASPICSPTRASVLTGRTPARTGVPSLHKRLVLQEKTLPQALQKAGYKTAHYGKWHLGGVQGSAMPILPDDPNGPKHYGFDEWLSATNYIEMNPLMTHNGEIVYLEGESSVLMVEAALNFIEQNQKEPLFIVLWYGSPHWPYTAEPQDLEGLSPELSNFEASLYGEIIGMDRSIGMLRDGLEKMDLRDNSLIWFCSDNGGRDHDPNAMAGLRGLKGSLYEGGIRVPGIIDWPAAIKKPMVTDVPASTMDMMPTIIDLLNLPEDSMLDVVDGESLVPLIAGREFTRTKNIPFSSKGFALIDGHYKLVRNGAGKASKWELYNLAEDPAESSDLSGTLPERFESMTAEAAQFQTSILASAEGKDYPEGRVLQPQRHDMWDSMPEYQALYDTFAQLKPGWKPPAPRLSKEERRALRAEREARRANKN